MVPARTPRPSSLHQVVRVHLPVASAADDVLVADGSRPHAQAQQGDQHPHEVEPVVEQRVAEEIAGMREEQHDDDDRREDETAEAEKELSELDHGRPSASS
jgi:hypothetical protein